jgi:hypothetical protein
MVKYCIDKYPKGTLKGQKTDGRYMDGYLHENLSVIARNMDKDITIMGILFSSTLEVGTGKSTLAQQIGEAYTEMINKKHGIDLTFDEKNIVFRPEKLMEVAPKLPKYSCIILDEWDEKTYFDKLAVALRQFFRKCRYLNQFMIIIIPDFFQLPKGYAISRSAFGIDVKFTGEFEKGYFDFYNFDRKKDLYIKGKKFYNYRVSAPNFSGRFLDGYAIDRKLYQQMKDNDFKEHEDESITKTDHRVGLYKTLNETMGLTNVKAAELFKVSTNTIVDWRSKLGLTKKQTTV